MDLQLKGRRALVTGSSSGIGTGIAQVLAAEGASVVVHGRDEGRTAAVAEAIAHAGGTVATATGDLMSEEGADRVADAALAAFGGIDILVNNAGGHYDMGVGWFSMPAASWAGTIDKNAGAAVRMIQRLHQPMVERGWGRIIQTGSFSGQTPGGDYGAYCAAKAAVASLSLSLAKALKFTGVTVNTVSPGLIETPDLDVVLERTAEAMGFPGEKQRALDHFLESILQQTVKRLGTPQDVGNLVAFLSSPLADFITGANYRIDGGASPSL